MVVSESRITAVILTFNRADELLCTVAHMVGLAPPVPLIVVSNGCTDDTARRLRARYPQVALIELPENIGAAARNCGAAAARTPYVAFCDDDTWWASGSLQVAERVLDAHPGISALTSRVVVEPEQYEDPVCAVMAASPLDRAGLPGPAVIGFLAGACVFRRSDFLAAGGYQERLFIGGEEALLALDTVTRGGSIVYLNEITVHHRPSPNRDARARRRLLIRNSLWTAWLRRPLARALQATVTAIRCAATDADALAGLLHALRGVRWVARHRRVVPPRVEALWRRVESRATEGRALRAPAKREVLSNTVSAIDRRREI